MKKQNMFGAALVQLSRKIFGDPEARLIDRAQTTYDWVKGLPYHSPERAKGLEELHQLLIKLEAMAHNDRSRHYRAEAEPLIRCIDKLMPVPNRP